PDVVARRVEPRVDGRRRRQDGALRQRYELDRAGRAGGGDEDVRVELRRERFEPGPLALRQARVEQHARLVALEVHHCNRFHGSRARRSSKPTPLPGGGTRRMPSMPSCSMNSLPSNRTCVTSPQRGEVACFAAMNAAPSWPTGWSMYEVTTISFFVWGTS